MVAVDQDSRGAAAQPTAAPTAQPATAAQPGTAAQPETAEPTGAGQHAPAEQPAPVDPFAGVLVRRLVHAALDQVAVGTGFFVLLVVSTLVGHRLLVGGAPLALALAPAAGSLLAMVAAFWWLNVWYPYRHRGVTPSMRLMGLRIVTETGREPRLRQYAVRWLMSAVDGALYGLVGVVVIVASGRRQRVGDMVAHTLVVRRHAQPGPVLTAPAGSPTPR